MRPLVAIFRLEPVKTVPVQPSDTAHRLRRLRLQRAVHPLMAPVLLRLARFNPVPAGSPSLIHHTLNRLSPSTPTVAKGDPLSVRIASGIPYSRNAASNTALGRDRLGLLHRLATQQEPAVGVRNRQRIAALPVAIHKPALVVRTPHLLRPPRVRQRAAGWVWPVSAAVAPNVSP